MEYTIDVEKENKSLGRIATTVAEILRGKNTPHYAPNVVPNVKVHIINASKLKLSDEQLRAEYQRYSGYPGGLKRETREHFIGRRGYEQVFKMAVKGMIPSNKLRPKMLKNLIVTE